MKKNLIRSIVVMSVLVLALAAFNPISAVSASYSAYRGSNGDGTCDGDLDGDGTCDVDGTPRANATSGTLGRWAEGFVRGNSSSNGLRGLGTGFSMEPLSDVEAAGLIAAIEEEYTALALYQSIMATFGEVAPFAEIAASEQMHANTLIRQAEKYGLVVPEYDFASFDFPTFATLDEAYQAGIDAETADAALYDTLMADVTHSDLIRVYTNLQNASLNNHLVSFQSYLAD